jgi:hypothetical protein
MNPEVTDMPKKGKAPVSRDKGLHTHVGFLVTDELYARLQEYVEHTGQPQGVALRRALEAYLAPVPPKPRKARSVKPAAAPVSSRTVDVEPEPATDTPDPLANF